MVVLVEVVYVFVCLFADYDNRVFSFAEEGRKAKGETITRVGIISMACNLARRLSNAVFLTGHDQHLCVLADPV